MRRFRRHSDGHGHPRPDFQHFGGPPHHIPHPPRRSPFGGGRGARFFEFDDQEYWDDDDSSTESGFPGRWRSSFDDDDWGRRGMRRGRSMDDIDDYYPRYAADPMDFYDSDFQDEGYDDYIDPYPRPRHPQRHHRHETTRRAPHPNSGNCNKHSHQHQQHRSSHHQHHHVHHHQYIHNYTPPVSALASPRYGYDDGYEQNGHGFPALSYSNGGGGGGALLPYNRQPRRCGLPRSPRAYGCAVHGGASFPRGGMALGPPLPAQLGIPVPRRY